MKTHCRECGTKLRWSKWDAWNTYDPKTGKRKYTRYTECSKYEDQNKIAKFFSFRYSHGATHEGKYWCFRMNIPRAKWFPTTETRWK